MSRIIATPRASKIAQTRDVSQLPLSPRATAYLASTSSMPVNPPNKFWQLIGRRLRRRLQPGAKNGHPDSGAIGGRKPKLLKAVLRSG